MRHFTYKNLNELRRGADELGVVTARKRTRCSRGDEIERRIVRTDDRSQYARIE